MLITLARTKSRFAKEQPQAPKNWPTYPTGHPCTHPHSCFVQMIPETHTSRNPMHYHNIYQRYLTQINTRIRRQIHA